MSIAEIICCSRAWTEHRLAGHESIEELTIDCDVVDEDNEDA